MQERFEQERGRRIGTGHGLRWARWTLMALTLAWMGVAAAQIPSGDPSPFIEAEIDVDASVELPGVGATGVKAKVTIDSDGLGGVLDAIVGALCRIFPCRGDDDEAQTQALLRADGPRIGDARTGIVLEGGAIGIGDFFGGIAVEEATYEWGFFARFGSDGPVQVRSVSFAADAFLTEAYLRTLGLEGAHYVPEGTYFVVDRKLTIPVQRQR